MLMCWRRLDQVPGWCLSMAGGVPGFQELGSVRSGRRTPRGQHQPPLCRTCVRMHAISTEQTLDLNPF